MEETHSSTYAMHLGSTKMYKTLKAYYWWLGMQREIAKFKINLATSQPATLKSWWIVVPFTKSKV